MEKKIFKEFKFKNVKNKKTYSIAEINQYINMLKNIRLDEEKKITNECLHKNKEITFNRI